MDETYRLVFRAEVLDGQHPAVVKKRLVQALKLTSEQAERLFSGKAVVVKKAADTRTAARYQALFKEAGARLRVMPTGGGSDADMPTAPTAKAEQDRPKAAAATAPTRSDSAATMTMLPPGSDLLTDAERQALPPVVVSTDHLSVAEVGVRLAEARAVSMPERLAEVSFDVADVGADLQESRQQPPPALVPEDVVFELAEPGADMGQARREPPPPAPDVSHLSVLPD